MATSNDYRSFTTFAQSFSASHSKQDIPGDDYDQPNTIVYRQAIHKLPGGGQVEVNTITPQASPAFAWEVEITLNDKQGGRFVHLILQRDHEVVETYGKTIIPVDTARAAEIQDLLTRLTAVE